MDKDRIKGKAKDIAGRVERQAGEWTGDSETQAKGAAKQAEGKLQNAWGKVKDKARDVKDKAEEETADNKANESAEEEEIRTGSARRRETNAPLGSRNKRAA